MSTFSYMAGLVDCLRQQMEQMNLPELCFLAVVPGEAAAQDYMGDCEDKNGMAWVRCMTQYPMVTIGQPDTRPANCRASLGADIEIGVIRAAPIPDEHGNLPDEADQSAISSLVMDDAMAMFRAIQCCDEADVDEVVVGPWLPLGPEGGVAGGTVSLSVGL